MQKLVYVFGILCTHEFVGDLGELQLICLLFRWKAHEQTWISSPHKNIPGKGLCCWVDSHSASRKQDMEKLEQLNSKLTAL